MKSDEMKNNLPKGWVRTKITDVCELINGRAFKPNEWASEGLPIIRIQNLNDDRANFNYCNFPVDEKYFVNNGELLFAWSGTPGTSFGAHIWKRGKAVLNQHIFRVVINEECLDKVFLMHLLNQNVEEYIRKAHGTAGLAHITKGKFENSYIPLPPLPEQHRIVAKIEELFTRLDAGVEALKKIKAQLKRYRQAVLKYAFEGKLTQQWREANKGKIEPASALLERIKNVRANLRVRPNANICENNVGANLCVRPDDGQTHTVNGQTNTVNGQTHRSAPTTVNNTGTNNVGANLCVRPDENICANKSVGANLCVRPEPCDICVTQNENTNVGANLRVRPNENICANKSVGANLRVRPDKGQTHRFAPTNIANELPELPDGWVWTRLGEIVSFEYGKSLRKDKRDASGNVPVYGSNGLVGYHSKPLTKGPCVIIGRKGAAGAVHLSKVPCWPIDTTYYVYPPTGINLVFLSYLLSLLNLTLLDKSTAIPGLNRNDAYTINVVIPPALEQHKIVEEIESRFCIADNIEKVVEQSLKQAERLRQSILKRAFEGKLVPQDPNDEPAEKLLERIKKEKESRDSSKQKPKRGK